MEEKQHEALKKEMADWLYRAMDPSTPTTKGNETVRTVDYEIDGVTYVAPTLRMIDGKLKRYSTDDAIAEARRRGDGMRVPKGLSGTEFSNLLSKRIEKARGRPAGQSAEKAR